MNRESIALDPVRRPKNNQQFMAKRLPYWKTAAYRKLKEAERKEGCANEI